MNEPIIIYLIKKIALQMNGFFIEKEKRKINEKELIHRFM